MLLKAKLLLINFRKSHLALVGLTAITVFSKATEASLPKNTLFLFDQLEQQSNLTHKQFNQLVDQVVDFYKPWAIIQGATLAGQKNWDSPEVNSYAERAINYWMVKMYGGLARRPEITPDGFSLVICHEVGHHFGGFPLAGRGWPAVEGQADYYATETCLKAIWAKESAENADHAATVSATAKGSCDFSWRKIEDRNLCYRIADASQSMGNLLASLQKVPVPRFDSPDTLVVEKTEWSHPAPQCRLDTYLNGALCHQSVDLKIIPGRNHPAGQDSLEAEKVAAPFACFSFSEESVSVHDSRPRCWYKSRIGQLGQKKGRSDSE